MSRPHGMRAFVFALLRSTFSATSFGFPCVGATMVGKRLADCWITGVRDLMRHASVRANVSYSRVDTHSRRNVFQSIFSFSRFSYSFNLFDRPRVSILTSESSCYFCVRSPFPKMRFIFTSRDFRLPCPKSDKARPEYFITVVIPTRITRLLNTQTNIKLIYRLTIGLRQNP